MPSHPGLEGLYQPQRLLSEDAGAVVLIRLPVDPAPWNPLRSVQWAVLTGANVGASHTGLALAPSAREALYDAEHEGSPYILCSVLPSGDITAVLDETGHVPRDIVAIAEEAVSGLGW